MHITSNNEITQRDQKKTHKNHTSPKKRKSQNIIQKFKNKMTHTHSTENATQKHNTDITSTQTAHTKATGKFSGSTEAAINVLCFSAAGGTEAGLQNFKGGKKRGHSPGMCGNERMGGSGHEPSNFS